MQLNIINIKEGKLRMYATQFSALSFKAELINNEKNIQNLKPVG
jgi:hypothetical protein